MNMELKFHHIGMAVEDINAELEKLRSMDNVKVQKCYDSLQKVELALINFGGVYVELVKGKVVESFLRRNLKIYHVCYTVKNIESAIDYFKALGAKPISRPVPAELFNGRRVCFLLTPFGFLLEILEE